MKLWHFGSSGDATYRHRWAGATRAPFINFSILLLFSFPKTFANVNATKRLLHFLFPTQRILVATGKDFQDIPHCKVLSGFDDSLPVLYFCVLALLLFPKQNKTISLHAMARIQMQPCRCSWMLLAWRFLVWDHKQNTCGLALALFSPAHFLDELAMPTCCSVGVLLNKRVFLLSFDEEWQKGLKRSNVRHCCCWSSNVFA